MKNYKSIHLRRSSILVLFVMSLLLTSCMADFMSINRDKDKVPTDDLNKDNLWANYVQSMQLSIFAEDNNTYQRMDDLCGNMFAGYSGISENFSPSAGNYIGWESHKWHDAGFAAVYGSKTDGVPPVPGIMNSWNILRQKVDSSSVVFAVGEIVKVAGMHRISDMYGPIPYLSYGQKLYTPYDSQADIYARFFKELDHAVSVLSDFYAKTPAARPIASFDIIYGSDILKWIKFGNSLKLRLAMRIKYIDPNNAKKFAEEAVAQEYGIIEDNGGTAMIKSTDLYAFVNPYDMIINSYDDSRMGANMESFLKGYNDPRLSKYFLPTASGDYKGVRLGISNASRYITYSKSTIGSNTVSDVSNALFVMHAAEIYFLRAEGAIEGWNMNGSATELYNKGIETAMSLWKISGGAVTSYINDAASKPAAYIDTYTSGNSISTGDAKLSTITIKWEDGAAKEKKLERIITQKWLAMYPNGQEAWSEFRRTGYPKVFPVVTNSNMAQIPNGQFIKRIPLPTTEHLNNASLTNEAVTKFLGGTDSPGTKLWWDAKN